MYNRSKLDADSLKGFAFLVIILLVLTGLLIGTVPNFIGEDNALPKFQQLAGTDKVEIVQHSNNSLFFGNPLDVTFDLKIKGNSTTGRCTSGFISPIICRLYTGE